MHDHSLSPRSSSSTSSQERYLTDTRPLHYKLASLILKRRALHQIAFVLMTVAVTLSTCLFFFQRHTSELASAPPPSVSRTSMQWIAAPPPPDDVQEQVRISQFHTWRQEGGWIREDSRSARFLDGLQTYTIEGHTLNGLKDLVSSPASASKDASASSVTAVIRLHQHTPEQLDALLRQTYIPGSIVLVTESPMLSHAQAIAQPYADTATAIHIVSLDQQSPDDHAGWVSFLRQSIDADWVWLLDIHARPGPRHLEFMHALAHTDEYSDVLLGSHGVLLPSNVLHPPPDGDSNQLLCLPQAFVAGAVPNVTQPVDMVQGAWLLKREWLQRLDLRADIHSGGGGGPWSFYLAQRLQADARVPSVIVPAHPDDTFQLALPVDYCHAVTAAYEKDTAWRHTLQRHTSVAALDQRQRTMMTNAQRVVFVATNARDLVALHPLLCRVHRTNRQTQLHVVVMGDLLGQPQQASWPSSSCLADDAIVVHTLAADNHLVSTRDLMRVVDALSPRLLFHVSQNDDDGSTQRLIHSLAQSQGITPIGLPADQVANALWIAELPVTALQHWNDIDVELIVITDRRSHSLARLFKSLARSVYLGDSVGLKVYMEQSADLTTRDMVNGYPWPHGTKTVRHRARKGGLIAAITESWYPRNNDNYAVLLEDDIEVSPLFYVWTKYTVLKYRYDPRNRDPSMYGVSLYTPRNVPVYMDGRHSFDPEDEITRSPLPFPGPHSPYITPLPCSWGAVYFPEHWREFHEYIMGRISQPKAYNITVPESRSESWHYSWKKFYIEMAYLRAYVMLYPNFQDWASFSTNHLEVGQHIKAGTRTEQELRDFQVPLMETDVILAQLPGHRLPGYAALPVLDLWGRRTTMDALLRNAINWHPQVSACARRAGRFQADDLLCPFAEPTFKPVKPKKKKTPKEDTSQKVVQPIKFIYVSTDAQVPDDVLPKPINVSQMDSPVLVSPNQDDELLDLVLGYTPSSPRVA